MKKKAVEKLIHDLKSPDAAVRRSACASLGKLGDPTAIEPLFKLLGDSYYNIRTVACEALGAIGDYKAVDPLIDLLGDTNAYVRIATHHALVEIGTESVEPLIKQLDHNNVYIRIAACQALGEIGDERALEPLIEILDDEQEKIRHVAVQSLIKMGSVTVRPLIGQLENTKAVVRIGAVKALGEIGDKRAVEPLIDSLDDTDSNVRAALCQSLGKLGEERLADAFIGALDNKAIARRELAKLAAEGDNRAIDPLIKLLDDSQDTVRTAACQALGNLVNSRAIIPLMKIKDNQNTSSSVRESAQDALSELLDSPDKYIGITNDLFCNVCLLRYQSENIRTSLVKLVSVISCRGCGSLPTPRTTIEASEAIAVLDDGAGWEKNEIDGRLLINWSKKQTLFDFDKVEIKDAEDYHLESFCMAVGNDTDPIRKKRYKKMTCTINSDCHLSKSTINMLARTFGEVTIAATQSYFSRND